VNREKNEKSPLSRKLSYRALGQQVLRAIPRGRIDLRDRLQDRRPEADEQALSPPGFIGEAQEGLAGRSCGANYGEGAIKSG